MNVSKLYLCVLCQLALVFAVPAQTDSFFNVYKDSIETFSLQHELQLRRLFLNEPEKAKRIYRECMNIAKQRGLDSLYLYFNLELADLYRMQIRNDSAVKILFEGEKLAREKNDPYLLWRANYSLGYFYFYADLNPAAMIARYERALEYAIASADHSNVVKTYYALAVALRTEGEFELRRKVLRKALNYATMHGETKHVQDIHDARAKDFVELELYDSAAIARRNYRLIPGFNDTRLDTVSSNFFASTIMLELNELDSALYHLQILDEVSVRHRNPIFLTELAEQWRKYYERKGDYQSALQFALKHADMRDSLLQEEQIRSVAEMEVAYETEKKEAQIMALEQAKAISDLRFRSTLIGIVLAIFGIIFSVMYYRQRMKSARILAEQKLAEAERRRQMDSLQATLLAQENERQRIARDLHDSIGAMLSAANLYIKKAEDSETVNSLGEVQEIVSKAGTEVRRISHHMMPGILTKFGLFEAVEDFLDGIEENTNLSINYTHSGEDERYLEAIEIMVYRIIQEMVNNSVKHSEASNISLQIESTGSALLIDYEDDGKGFDPEIFRKADGFGMSSIQGRVQTVEGTVHLESAEGKGVHYHVEIPKKYAV